MTIPHITIEQAKAAVGISLAEGWLHSLNRMIDSANAQQESEYITVEQARELGAGNAEWLSISGDWSVCDKGCSYRATSVNDESFEIKYRAIKQAVGTTVNGEPMPVEEAQELLRTTYDSHDWSINDTTQIKRRDDVIALLKEEGLL
jgi:hypothetical protein